MSLSAALGRSLRVPREELVSQSILLEPRVLARRHGADARAALHAGEPTAHEGEGQAERRARLCQRNPGSTALRRCTKRIGGASALFVPARRRSRRTWRTPLAPAPAGPGP